MAQKTTFHPLTNTDMATKKGKREALLEALQELNDNTLRDDEFTVEDFIKEALAEAGKHVSRRTAHDTLQRLVNRGKYKSRQVVIKSRVCNAYSKP